MNVLLIGSGAREHALAWKLAQSPLLDQLFIAPGNPGTSLVGRNVPVNPRDTALLVDLARREQVGLVVIGPEAALAAGLADAFLAAGIPVFGPTKAAAQIESSKAFAKEIMRRAGVPTARAQLFDTVAAAQSFVREQGQPWVVKADGLAAGKGVVVAETLEETLAAIEQISASTGGQAILLEERLIGREVSLIALCDGRWLLPLPPAQDHKRLRDGDHGPNTGGMGAYAPAPHVGAELVAHIVDSIMLPVVRELESNGTPFRGALYAGLILTERGPQVLEFNARFGDPETQATMPLLEGDLLGALLACAEGRLDLSMLGWRSGAAACVVLAAAGYPEAPRYGAAITGIESIDSPNVLLFHAGTSWEAGSLVTSGGRVLGVTALADQLSDAVALAYDAIEYISFDGMQYRHDIGTGV